MNNEKITFNDIRNHFGNRGVEIDEHCFKSWQIDDKYIYWIPNNEKLREWSSDHLCADSDNQDQIIWCIRNSMCIEVYDSIPCAGDEKDLAVAARSYYSI